MCVQFFFCLAQTFKGSISVLSFVVMQALDAAFNHDLEATKSTKAGSSINAL
jgi:hypothetical protein